MSDNIYDFEKEWDGCHKKAINVAVVILIVIICLSMICSISFKYANFMMTNQYNLFETHEPSRVVFMQMNEKASDEQMQLEVQQVKVNDESITIIVSGHNSLYDNWEMKTDTFILSVFSYKNSKSRSHYFSESTESYEINKGQSFVYTLTYDVPKIKEKISNGAIFSLMAYKNADNMPNTEIMLDITECIDKDGVYCWDIPLSNGEDIIIY